MNILYIWDADYPWDVRVDKITNSLSESIYQHRVHIACRNLRKETINQVIRNVTIHRLWCFQNNKINNIVSTPLPLNPLWLIKLFKIIVENKINILIIRDLPLALSAIILAKVFRIPLIFDMAEDYPAMLEGINRVNNTVVNKIFRNPVVARYLESIVCSKADSIIVVVEESKQRLCVAGIDHEKIEIVGNTPNLKIFKKNDIVRKDNDKIILLYIGGIQLVRGLQMVIESLNILTRHAKNIKLKIIGDGYALPRLKELSQALKVDNYIEFTGFIAHGDLPNHIAASDICIIPHKLNDHTKTTVPNKLFDYMALRKAVIVSDIPPLKRIVQEEQCGLVFKNGDPVDFTKKIIEMMDPKKRITYGENGLRAVQSKYNWDVDIQKLIKIIDRY